MPAAKSAERMPDARLAALLAFDARIKGRWQRKAPPFLVGVDEVGRGCLAGPVVAAAVCLPPVEEGSPLACRLKHLNDSKVLAAATREVLAGVIREVASYGIGEASPAEIDELNILRASLLAMKRALQSLSHLGRCLVLVDGNRPIPALAMPQLTVVQGDSKSASIAAASVVAKVHRDNLMVELASAFPEYCWEKNKGYGSADHLCALTRLGPTPYHRLSFQPCAVTDAAAVADE